MKRDTLDRRWESGGVHNIPSVKSPSRLTTIQEATTSTYLLAWIPESLLTEKGQEEGDKFLKTEERPLVRDEDKGLPHLLFILVAGFNHSPTQTACWLACQRRGQSRIPSLFH